MKLTKRTIAILLAVLIVVSISASVFAAARENTNDEVYTAVEEKADCCADDADAVAVERGIENPCPGCHQNRPTGWNMCTRCNNPPFTNNCNCTGV